jgi:hypothetical protein
MQTKNSPTKMLLLCGFVGCPLFIIVFLIEGALRADYNFLKYPVSNLSIGDSGWIQILNFIITGILILFFSIGLRRISKDYPGKFWVPLLIALVGIGLIGAGIFTTDPIYGYPPDKPLILAQHSLAGHLHNLFSLFVFACLPASCFVMYNRFIKFENAKWAIYSLLSGLVMIATFVLAGLSFGRVIPSFIQIAGLFQRLSIITGWIWITLLAVHFIREDFKKIPNT